MSKNFSIVGVWNNLQDNRAGAITSNLANGVTIDTCMCGDTHEYETGIKCANSGTWVIVEQYGTDADKAALGHASYIDRIMAGEVNFISIQDDITYNVIDG